MRRVTLFFAVVFMLSMPQLGWAQDDSAEDALGLNDAEDASAESQVSPESDEQVDFASKDLDDTDAALGASNSEQKDSDSNDDKVLEPEGQSDFEQPETVKEESSHKKIQKPSAQQFNPVLLVQPGHENAPGEHVALLPLLALDPAIPPQRVATLEHLLFLSLLGRKDFDVVDLRRSLEPVSGKDASRLIENATAMYVAGRQSYENLESEKAIEQLEAACSNFESGYAGLRDPYTMAIAHVYLASVYMQNGQAEAGAPYYRRALFLEPKLELDINVFAPEDIDALEAQRSFINSSSKGRVEVQSLPVSTRVYVDNIFRGSSPLEIDGLAPGRHFLRLERNGYESVADVVEVKSGQLAGVKRHLIPLRGNNSLRHYLVLAEPESVDLGGVLKPLGVLFSARQALILTGHLMASGQIQARIHYVDLGSGLRLHHSDGTLAQDQAAASAALRSLVDQALDLSDGVESQASGPLLDLSGMEDVKVPWTPILASLGGVIALGAAGAGTYYLVSNQPAEGRTLQGGERTVILGF